MKAVDKMQRITLIKIPLNFFALASIILLLFACNENSKYDTRCSNKPKYHERFDLPKGLIGYNSYQLAYECSQMTKKPMAIYFGGDACVNCRQFESIFLYKKKTIELLNKHYVFTYLKLDDNTELPKDEQKVILSKYSSEERKLKSVGNLNASLVYKYEHCSQPSLFIADHNENVVSLIQFDPNSTNLTKTLDDVTKSLILN